LSILAQAIALSLQDSANDVTSKEIKGDAHVQGDAGRRRKKRGENKTFFGGNNTESYLFVHLFFSSMFSSLTLLVRIENTACFKKPTQLVLRGAQINGDSPFFFLFLFLEYR
jgi:hypothetical protein